MADVYVAGLRTTDDMVQNDWMNRQRREERAREINLQRDQARFRYDVADNLRQPVTPVTSVRRGAEMPAPIPAPVDPSTVVPSAATSPPSAGLKTTLQGYQATGGNWRPIAEQRPDQSPNQQGAYVFSREQLENNPQLAERIRQLAASGQIDTVVIPQSGNTAVRIRPQASANREAADILGRARVGDPGMPDAAMQAEAAEFLGGPQGPKTSRSNVGNDQLRALFTPPNTAQRPEGRTALGVPDSPQATAQPTSFTGGGSRTVATDIPEVAQGLLAHLRRGESGGRYDIAFSPNGTRTFPIPQQGHPGQSIAIAIPDGHPDRAAGASSSAFGAYQFIEGTWNDVIRQSGLPNVMTPENQDRAAWFLAQRDYQARTGRNLEQDLANPATHATIMRALQPTWTSLRGQAGQFQAPTGSAPQSPGATVQAAAPALQRIYQSVTRSPEGLPFTVQQAQEAYDQNAVIFQAAQRAGLPDQMIAAANAMREANTQAISALGYQAAMDIIQSGNTARAEDYFGILSGGAEIRFQPFDNGTFSYSVDGVEQGRGTREEIASEIMSLVNSEYLEAQRTAQQEQQQALFESNLRIREDAFSQQLEGQRDITLEAFRAELERQRIDPQTVRPVELANGGRGVIYQTPDGRIILREFRETEQRGPSTNGRGDSQTVATLGPEMDITDSQ